LKGPLEVKERLQQAVALPERVKPQLRGRVRSPQKVIENDKQKAQSQELEAFLREQTESERLKAQYLEKALYPQLVD
jgi:hypothetical protein